MMDRVTCRPIDDGTIGNVFSVVNHYGPEVDEGKQAHIGKFLQRKDEWEDMVWQALGKAVQRVKGVARKRGPHGPFKVTPAVVAELRDAVAAGLTERAAQRQLKQRLETRG